jgi:F0F1-type ATP synthase assembly protein I
MENPQKKEKPKNSPNEFVKYGNIAFKMMAIILLGVFGGRKLDGWIKPKFPVFTISLTLLSLVGAFYSMFKDINQPKN